MILFSSIFMILSFLMFRNKRVICPSNVVFGNYFLYFIFPAALFYFLDLISWSYVLPWGKLNNWAVVSREAVLSYLYVFSLFFFFTRLLERLFERVDNPARLFEYRVRPWPMFVCAFLLLIGCAYFFHATGGLDVWISSYSDTYLMRRKGYGVLNFLLIMFSNFLAFWVGFYCRTAQRKKWLLVAFVFVVLAVCTYLQGIKSRIFFFGIFFSLPWLVVARLSMRQGALLFAGFMLLFSAAMYVRSDGFYDTPEKLLEYFLTYFNTIFLHDMVLRDMPAGYFETVTFPLNKWLSLLGVPSPDYMHDISRWLTSIYYPKQWFEESATQQWPVETELYLNYGPYFLWFLPIAIYSAVICFLYSLRFRGGPVLLFIFMSEILVFLGVFRSSMLQWIVPFNFGFYMMLVFARRYFFYRVLPVSEGRDVC